VIFKFLKLINEKQTSPQFKKITLTLQIDL